MVVCFIERGNAQKRTGDTRVGDIDFGAFYQPLLQVRLIRRHDIDHERLLQEINVAPYRHVGYAER